MRENLDMLFNWFEYFDQLAAVMLKRERVNEQIDLSLW